MLLAGLFAGCLFLGMLAADWLYFRRLALSTTTYGCRIARGEEQIPSGSWTRLLNQVDPQGILQLPHGVARLFYEERRILLRPNGAYRFRTAWPMNGSMEIHPDGETTRIAWVKRIPWSSAILTLTWFILVLGGTLAFAIMFALDGGFATLTGLVMALGIFAIGTLVLVFGLVTVSLAYRLENQRLGEVYQELRTVLTQTSP